MVREIKNKAFRNALKKEGLSFVHLYKDGTYGYHYITCDVDFGGYVKENSIYLNSFGQQPIKAWIEDIRRMIIC